MADMLQPPRGGSLGTDLDEVVLAEARATRAGSRVATLSQANGHFLSHFEHTAWLPLPEAWEPENRPDLGIVSGWKGGVRPETKFRHFRLDRMVGSYHPGQRAKWTAHELAHKLVGWAWWPEISILELATAARVAEVLPVALWYFFDEADRRRCELHAEVDAWGATLCRDCEAAAAGPSDTIDEAVMAAGLRFVERELAAAEVTLATGRSRPTPWRSVDLCSDGFAWAAAHGPRLRDPAFASWVDAFVPDGHGRWSSLPALIERVRAATAAVVSGAPLPPWIGTRKDWILQDVSARVMQVRTETEGEASVELDRMLAAAAADREVETLVKAYVIASDEWELPLPDDVFGVGYALPGASGLGLGPTDLEAALRSAVPRTAREIGRGRSARMKAFAKEDRWQRRPFVRRLQESTPPFSGPIGTLFALEVALADPPPANLISLTLAEEVDARGPLALGSVEIVQAPTGWDRMLAGATVPSGETVAVAVLQGADGGAVAVELSSAAAAASVQMRNAPTVVHNVALDERAALIIAGVWVAASTR